MNADTIKKGDAPVVTAAQMDEDVVKAKVTKGEITKGDGPATVKPEDGSTVVVADGTVGPASTFEGEDGKLITQGAVADATATKRNLSTIDPAELKVLQDLAKERGVQVEDLPEFTKVGERKGQTGTAAEGTAGTVQPVAEIDAAVADYYAADFTPQANDTEIDDVPAFKKASARVAQVGEAASRIANELGNAPSVDLEGRKAITGTAPQGDAAQIGGVPTMQASTMQAVTGKERTTAAADMMLVVGNVPEPITAALAEDPASVEAKIDSEPVEVIAAIAALPKEALVSTQMEGLLAGMEEGKTPLWAKPAVDAINQQMASRGMTASTVGRDALFNAIIQSALPMAQSNAQALQARAQQNLSNEQQANCNKHSLVCN
jgi:hypothetical protein